MIFRKLVVNVASLIVVLDVFAIPSVILLMVSMLVLIIKEFVILDRSIIAHCTPIGEASSSPQRYWRARYPAFSTTAVELDAVHAVAY